jgi:hypothetical protein
MEFPLGFKLGRLVAGCHSLLQGVIRHQPLLQTSIAVAKMDIAKSVYSPIVRSRITACLLKWLIDYSITSIHRTAAWITI